MFYKLGQLAAQSTLNTQTKTARRRLMHPSEDLEYLGDQELPESHRLNQLQSYLDSASSAQLPGLGKYMRESATSGALGLGAAGAALGSIIGAPGGPKAMLGGALLGGVPSALLGGAGGAVVGAIDQGQDEDAQQLSMQMQDPVAKLQYLTRLKTLRDQQLAEAQRSHEERLQQMNQERHNYNYDMNQ